MREIKFRGWDYTHSMWRYGCLNVVDNKPYIVEEDYKSYLVNPASVGQYTGMYDSSTTHKYIYEGDIIQETPTHLYDLLWIVEFDNVSFKLRPFGKDGGYQHLLEEYEWKDLRVVGNMIEGFRTEEIV
tara:strand:- start:158 stop:541 length:384 start_codon:yes stop_codon:yes gene_type:complete